MKCQGVMAIGSLGPGHIGAEFIPACLRSMSAGSLFVFTLNEIESKFQSFRTGGETVASLRIGQIVHDEFGDHIKGKIWVPVSFVSREPDLASVRRFYRLSFKTAWV